MFGKRADGRLVKTHSGLYLLVPHIMPHRYDSMNMTEFDIEMDTLDEIVRIAKEKTGVVYSYLEILVCIIQRILYLRPELNRFVVNKRIYQRNLIQYSMVVQRSLRPGAESNETSIKVTFDGTESLSQVKDKLDAVIKEAKGSQNDTDKLTTALAKIPHFIMRFVVNMLKWLDKHGLLPRSVMDAEPFHTSFFLTDLKSVKCTSIYHHVYEFGTTGLFFSTGIEKCQPYFKKGTDEVVYKKVMPVKFVSDERFCDGFYFARSLNEMLKMLKRPEDLLKPLTPRPLTKEEEKIKRKEEKYQAKIQAKKEKARIKAEKKAKKENN